MKTAKWMTIGLAAVIAAALPQWTLAKDRGKSGKDGNVGKTGVAKERAKSGKDGNTGGSSSNTLTAGRVVQQGHGKAAGDNGHGAGKGENAHGVDGGENGHGGTKGQNEPKGADGHSGAKGKNRPDGAES